MGRNKAAARRLLLSFVRMRFRSLKSRLILRFVAGVILLPHAACSRTNSERADAQALLERISAVDLRAPLPERARQVAALRGLELHDAALASVRDRCARVHAGLLAAEEEQANARERLGRAEQQKPSEAELQAIAASVAHAAAQLRAAQGELPACEDSTRALALRFH